MTSRKIENNIIGGLWAYYGPPEDDYVAKVCDIINPFTGKRTYWLTYHHSGRPILSGSIYTTLGKLEVAMRKLEPDLRKWRKQKTS